MNDRLRVLLVGRGHPEQGGIATFLDLLLRSRLAADHDVELLNLTPAERRGGGRFDRRNLGRTARDARALWRRADSRDVVHLHSALAPSSTLLRAGLLAAVARARGAGVVVHAHGGRLPAWLRSDARRAVLRAALAPASAVVAVSSEGAEALERALGAAKVALVDNGVDPGPPPGPPAQRVPRVLYVGVVTPRKGVLDLLGASAALREEGVSHELWIVGGTPDEGPEAEAEVRAATGPDTRVLGPLPHAEALATYRDVDVFCLPSWWEAMPLSVLEAMAAGLPVVASRVGDVPRVVEDGTTGILVEPKAVGELVAALRTLLEDADARRRMGAAGRARLLSSFTLDRAIDAVEHLYRQAARRT